MTLGGAVFATLAEKPQPREDMLSLRQSLAQLSLLRRDGQLARFVLARSLLVGTALAPPYLLVLAAGQDADDRQLGLLVLASALADARLARIAGDIDRLARAAAVIEKEAPSSVDAPYYRGLVQEARGEREAALASYRSVLDRAGRGRQTEPPDELVFLIRRLQGGRR